MNLDDLGSRICVFGPSNSGKSTLAAAIGRAQGLSVVHLDQLRHVPGTQWELRADDEFVTLQGAAVGQDSWVIDGNYARHLQQRLERATGLILLDSSGTAGFVRYVRRTIAAKNRIGGLDGSRERLNLEMIRYIFGYAHDGRVRYQRIYEQAELPKVYLANRRALTGFYRRNQLALR